MPRIFVPGMMALLMIWACSPVKEASTTSAALARDSLDSTVYDIVIIDPHFDQWYSLNYGPAQDRSNEYYRAKNHTAAIRWNDYYRSGKHSNVIESYLDYRPEVDYGIEVNRKLYWYFKYIRSNYRINLFY